MHYIFIVILVIVLVVFLVKHILFNPRLNSALSIIALVVLSIKLHNGLVYVLSVIAIIDCVRDILMAEILYEEIEEDIDRTYAIKSILSIVTLGIARVVFILIIVPYFSFSASSDIKRKMKAGYPFAGSCDSGCKQNQPNYVIYYYMKIEKLLKQGKLVSNERTIKSEDWKSRARLDKLYPKKIKGKIVDVIAGDKSMKERRKNAENRINSTSDNIAYISADALNKYPQIITDAMSRRSVCSPNDIKDFEELKSLHFDEKINGSTQWAVYFIILALQPLVEKGEFTDETLNDNDVFDNHAYQYVHSQVQLKSTNADEDPRFALN